MQKRSNGIVTLALVLAIVAGLAFSQKSSSDRSADNKASIVVSQTQIVETCYRGNVLRASLNSLADSGEAQKQVLLRTVLQFAAEQKARGIKAPPETDAFIKKLNAVAYAKLELRDCPSFQAGLEKKLGIRLHLDIGTASNGKEHAR